MRTSADVVTMCPLWKRFSVRFVGTATKLLFGAEDAAAIARKQIQECLCYQIRQNEVFTIYQHRFLLPNWHKICSFRFAFFHGFRLFCLFSHFHSLTNAFAFDIQLHPLIIFARGWFLASQMKTSWFVWVYSTHQTEQITSKKHCQV